MEQVVAKQIINWCDRHYPMNGDAKTVVTYGIELLLNSGLKIAAILLAALLAGKFTETGIALACFCSLRSFAGGVHMKSSLGCFLSMVSVCGLSVGLSQLMQGTSIAANMVIIAFVLYSLWRYAPSCTQNNPIGDRVIRKHKKTGAMVVWLILSTIVLYTPIDRFQILILAPMLIEAITILPIVNRAYAKEETK